MKRTMKMLIVIFMTVLMLIGCATANQNSEPSEQQTLTAYQLLATTLNQSRTTHLDFWRENSVGPLKSDVDVPLAAPTTLNAMESITFEFTMDQTAQAHLQALIRITERTLINPILRVSINGSIPYRESATVDVAIRWRDESKNFSLDSYGDESLPNQIADNSFRKVDFYNNTYSTSRPLTYLFNQGINTVTITNVSSDPIDIASLKAVVPWDLPTYVAPSTDKIKIINFEQKINAIDYTSKNSSFIRLSSHPSVSVSPYDPVDKKLNVIDGVSWSKSGQSVDYPFSVPQSGYYNISFHYSNSKPDFSVFRSIAIDGQVPFEEVESYAFTPTKTGKWEIETLKDSNGDPFWFYLEVGNHVLTLRGETAPIQRSLDTLQLMIDHINQFALDIRKITGKEVDRNRTWKLTNFLPETADILEAYEISLESVLAQTSEFAPNGKESTTLSYLQKALYKIRKMREKPDELPLYLDDLYSQTGSVTEMIGISLTELSNQSLSINEIAVSDNKTSMIAEASWVSKASSGVQSFIASFTSKKYVAKKDPEMLNIWVNRSITYVDTMQKLVDSDFTVRTGIKVKISVMPDVNRLILANAANQSPDVALGLPSYMPFDFAIRGAAYPLSDFEDYWKVAGTMAPGAFVPYLYEGKSYALPETLDFHTLIYRTDIFNGLNLDVPDTWQDVLDLLPELQRYGMNFYYLTAGGGSLKWFYQTSPFIYQYGGSLYDSSGYRSGIDSVESVAGIRFLTELFTTYSIPEQVPSFYNSFRYGTLPVGIADFGTYLQIKNAAPELAGQWALAPYPGTINSEGEVVRWDIVNGTSGMIFANTEKPKQSWDFMKWWMETETQTSFAYNLQSTYGPEYVWLSANLDAVANSPIEYEDKLVILEQSKWLNDVPRTPGQYMLERGMSDIWNTTVFDGTPVRIAIDRQKQTIDREIRRKMIEFGFLDRNGDVIRPYMVFDIDWIKEQIENAKED
ncbi:MAG: extracellular solute-binding protein [Erysipelotrichaceae bacterium]|nr:extracellular solute-binding protein [Erysipelotrichaceae bacterium]